MTTLPLIVVTVGTDHHPFDRLIGWVDEFVAGRGGQAEIVVQYGYSRQPEVATIEAMELVSFDTLRDLLKRADVVVTPGPNTIMEAREYGVRGIYVPRDPVLGEHVDDHQIVFARHSAEEGLFTVVNDRVELFEMLDAAIADPLIYHFDPSTVPHPPAIARIGAMVDALVWGEQAGPE